MKELSKTAKEHLEKYLQEVRVYLRGCKSVDADEIQRDITEHIENELVSVVEPISSDDIDTILKRLGNPQRWVPEEELTWWRKIVLRLRTGPEDWRLAYMSFALLVIAITIGIVFNGHHVQLVDTGQYKLLANQGTQSESVNLDKNQGEVCIVSKSGSGWTICWFLVLASFCLSRAAVSATDSDSLNEQKWLLYPPLVLVYILGTIYIVGLSILAAWALGDYIWSSEIGRQKLHIISWISQRLFTINITGLVTGFFLSILAVISYKWPSTVQIVFRPFADWYDCKWARWIILFSIGLLFIFSIMAGLMLTKIR